MSEVPGLVFQVFAFVLGAIVGSFLNACIHRMPRGISLRHPRRSFCPACENPIAWHQNLPIVSYLMLRGKCAKCGARISPRYLLVEILTAGLFLALWEVYGFPLAPVYWVLVSLLIAGTFIDFEHLIIPDEITWGGTAAGVLFCLLVPQLMETDSRLAALGWSLFGAVLGIGLLWGVVEAGKLAFGRKRHRLKPPEPFKWEREGDSAVLQIGEDSMRWEEVFPRASDRLVLECDSARAGQRDLGKARLIFSYDQLVVGEETFDLETVEPLRGRVREVIVPREAMGMGDVKFLAAIGAFLGWKAVLFTIFAASVIGCVFGVAAMIKSGNRESTYIPFGPYLALGAVLWLFGGQVVWEWYFQNFPGTPGE